MGIIAFLNSTFGIDNNVSVPILISLIVFIIGGLANFLIKSINSYYSNLRIRNSYRVMLKEIVRQCELKEKFTKFFYPTLIIEHQGHWPMKFFRMSYVETATALDFNIIFNSFGHIFRIRNKKKLRLKAFNKMWSTIENLRFYENRIVGEFETLFKQFTEHENKYQYHLEELRKSHDKFFQPLIGRPITPGEFTPIVFNYVKEQDRIWHEWEIMENRTSNINRYSNLIIPLLALNRHNPGIDFTLEINNCLLAAEHEFCLMNNILGLNRRLFYNYYRNYRSSKMGLKKCLEILG